MEPIPRIIQYSAHVFIGDSYLVVDFWTKSGVLLAPRVTEHENSYELSLVDKDGKMMAHTVQLKPEAIDLAEYENPLSADAYRWSPP